MLSALARTWQQNLKRGALAGGAHHADAAAMGAQNALHRRETQTASHELSRVEGVEDFGLCLLGHSAARVGYFQVAVIARGQIQLALHGRRFSDAHLSRADRDLSGLAL